MLSHSLLAKLSGTIHTYHLLQVVWVGTCLGAILLGLDLGLAVGLGVELLTVVYRTQL